MYIYTNLLILRLSMLYLQQHKIKHGYISIRKMSLMILIQSAIIEYVITVMAPLSFTVGSTNISKHKPRLVSY